MKAGYKLLSEDGQWQVVQSVIQTEEPLSAYNLTVNNDHTYFVTGSDSTYGVWVHNTCNLYNGIKNAPKYPSGFRDIQNGKRGVNVNNFELLQELRLQESGKWKKIYRDGYDSSGKKVSIHYFESQSGKVFDVKVKSGWSNF